MTDSETPDNEGSLATGEVGAYVGDQQAAGHTAARPVTTEPPVTEQEPPPEPVDSSLMPTLTGRINVEDMVLGVLPTPSRESIDNLRGEALRQVTGESPVSGDDTLADGEGGIVPVPDEEPEPVPEETVQDEPSEGSGGVSHSAP